MIRRIEGHHNQSVKLARKLQKKKLRRDRGLFLTEGLDLLVEGVGSGRLPREVLVREDLVDQLPENVLEAARADRLEVGVCRREVLEHASGLAGAGDVIALFAELGWSLGDLDPAGGPLLYLYQIGDPGNVGTLVRSAAAFGAAGIVTSPGTADAFGPKALRAGMGAQFLLPVVEEVSPVDLLAKIAADEERGGAPPAIFLADPQGGLDVTDMEARPPVLLVLGAERGELPELGPGARRVAIPQARADSLNVAMAGTVLLYRLAVARPPQRTK
jgi:RNA methyltransferase, TrmH family